MDDPTETAIDLVDNLALVALTPSDMPEQQRKLSAWCARKIDLVERELGHYTALQEEAVNGGFKWTTYAAGANRAAKRVDYYKKMQAAVDAGYLIVPNMPTITFAVRVKRGRPKRNESGYESSAAQALPELLPTGEGRYVDDTNFVDSEIVSGTDHQNKPIEKVRYFASAFDDDVDFPLQGVMPELVNALPRPARHSRGQGDAARCPCVRLRRPGGAHSERGGHSPRRGLPRSSERRDRRRREPGRCGAHRRGAELSAPGSPPAIAGRASVDDRPDGICVRRLRARALHVVSRRRPPAPGADPLHGRTRPVDRVTRDCRAPAGAGDALMPSHRRYSGPPRRHFAYAELTDAEFVVVRAAAQREGLKISDFVRRCVNGYFLDQGDDGPLLDERGTREPRPTLPRSTRS